MAGVKDFIQADELQRNFEELLNGVRLLVRRMETLEMLLAPKREDRLFEKPFQVGTVQPTDEQEIYRQTIPRQFVGVITRIGNDWFPKTVLLRFIDDRTMEPAIERIIAPVTDPLAVKIFVRNEVVWRARNNDGVAHTFGILTDGFFLPADVAERIMAIED